MLCVVNTEHSIFLPIIITFSIATGVRNRNCVMVYDTIRYYHAGGVGLTDIKLASTLPGSRKIAIAEHFVLKCK